METPYQLPLEATKNRFEDAQCTTPARQCNQTKADSGKQLRLKSQEQRGPRSTNCECSITYAQVLGLRTRAERGVRWYTRAYTPVGLADDLSYSGLQQL